MNADSARGAASSRPPDLTPEFSLADAFLGRSQEYYAVLREQAPVFYSQADKCYILTRYHDVKALLHDYELFDSRQGMEEFFGSEEGEGAEEPEESSGGLDFDPIFLQSPPNQTRLRRLAAKAYSVASAEEFEQQSRGIAARVLDELPEKAGGFDLIADYAAPVAIGSILSVLEVPEADRSDVYAMVLRCVACRGGPDGGGSGPQEVAAYLAGHLGRAKAGAVCGFSSKIVNSEVNGDHFTDGEAFGMLFFSVLGGTEDMVRAIGGFAYALWLHRDQRRRLLDDLDARIEAAIWESLRLFPTTQYVPRVITSPITLHGVNLEKGSKVIGLLGAANRDERVFSNAEQFEIERKNVGASLTFGGGPHVCIGRNFAKVIVKSALLELLKRYPDYDLDMQESKKGYAAPILGFESLKILTKQ